MIRRLSGGKRLAVVVALVLAVGGVMAVAFGASPPPAPSITASPSNPTPSATATSAAFTYSDSQAGVTFKCSLDSAAFTTCPGTTSGGITYSSVPQGSHTFRVEAVSGSGTSNITSFSWAIVPPAPTIITNPSNPTGATSATFTFNEPSQPSVGFKCALDASSFTTCTSGKTYTGLLGGTHIFQVEAQVGSNPPSLPTSFTWTVDLSAPVITITFPANGGSYNAAGWSASCSPVGICGTASDTPAGVQSVAVALLQVSSGKYWNGTAFTANAITFNPTTGTPTVWRYAKTLPVDGQYTVSVQATDNFGNTTANGDLKTATFTIDTVPPAAPVITNKPTNPSTNKNPEFEYTDTSSPVTFTCKLDAGSFAPCPDHKITYTNLSVGPHCFSVYATDAAGNVGPTTTYCWTISGTSTNTITANSGTPQTATAGGTFAAPLVAKVTNASNSPVAGVTVTFTAPAAGASGTFHATSNGSACLASGGSAVASCTAATNASGLASALVFTANNTTGAYTVSATAPATSGIANFSLTNGAVVTFQISGPTLAPSFYPGVTRTLDLSVTNPNASPLTVPTGGITIGINTGTALCPPFSTTPPNFAVTSNGQSFVIPGGTTSPVTLSSLGVTNLPTIKMNNTSFNQDGCKSAHLTLNYTGNGTGS